MVGAVSLMERQGRHLNIPVSKTHHPVIDLHAKKVKQGAEKEKVDFRFCL